MIDVATVGGAVIALSAGASGAFVAVAYHVPARLRDGWEAASRMLLHPDAEDLGASAPPREPPADLG